MKVRLIVDAEGPNPEFNPKEDESALNPHSILIPAGTEIEDPKAWVHCLKNASGKILAEPIDKEAVDKVQQFLTRGQARATLKTAEQLAILKAEAAAAEEAGKEKLETLLTEVAARDEARRKAEEESEPNAE